MNNIVKSLIFICLIFSSGLKAQDNAHERNMQWWREARFGMFIHWGLYAVPAGEWNGKTGYGEWIRNSAEIPLETYDKFLPQFNPVEFNADQWVKMAKDAGMKYIVITSKHHDGFCMFNTKETPFNIMNSPFHRDPMLELAAACKKYGLKFCFYYSIMDWHHPDYLPRREWEKDRTAEGADFDRYVAYMKAEIRELLTHYGDIGVLWFDGEWERTWNQERGLDLYQYVKSLQPEILVNNRVGAGRIDMEGWTKKGMFGGDFGTPEQQIPPKGLPGTDWETCMTMNDHWGYNSHDKNFKSTGDIIRMLVDIASKGGNYLLNVGPDAKGKFPQESIDRLKETGNWMKVNGEAVYGTTASPLSVTPWGRCTYKKGHNSGILYLHVFNWPIDGQIRIEGCMNDVINAYLLADHKSLKTSRNEDIIVIDVLKTAPDTICTVIALELKGAPDFTDPPEIVSDFGSVTDSLEVKLISQRDNVEIRYSVGDLPVEINSANSLYDHPLILKKECVVSARCFRNGKAVSHTASRKFDVKIPLEGVKLNDLLPGLNYRYFEGMWDSVPDFGKLSGSAGITDSITLSIRKRNENFAVDFRGYLKVDKRGLYRFTFASDDAGILYIDNQIAVNHDGLHAATEKTGEVALEKGLHPFRIAYVQRTGSAELRLFIESKDMPKVPVTKEMLFHE